VTRKGRRKPLKITTRRNLKQKAQKCGHQGEEEKIRERTPKMKLFEEEMGLEREITNIEKTTRNIIVI